MVGARGPFVTALPVIMCERFSVGFTIILRNPSLKERNLQSFLTSKTPNHQNLKCIPPRHLYFTGLPRLSSEEGDNPAKDDYLDWIRRKSNATDPEPGSLKDSDVTPVSGACIGIATSEVRFLVVIWRTTISYCAFVYGTDSNLQKIY
jgi:hypothetical protein